MKVDRKFARRGDQVVYADANGDKVPDVAVNVVSDHPLAAADFLL